MNQQAAPRDDFAGITDSRIWQTSVYDGVYFNDFIKSNLANDIIACLVATRDLRGLIICITVNSDALRSTGK